MSKVVEKFLKYVKFDTRSDEESYTSPSTSKQIILAEELVKDLKNMGIKEAKLDKYGYVTAKLPANIEKDIPAVGLIAHMDTSPEISGENVKPKIIENYDGKNIVLNEEENIILSTEEFPEIRDYIGKTIITTDGTTLLGADDKAGIAEIMEAVEYLAAHPEIKHGDICIAFTPDEEVGRGTENFNADRFGADLAYTMDGGVIGELEYENFNAAVARITIKGRNVHPGYAKGKMINSMLIAAEFISMLPKMETPENTEGYEGFYHLTSIAGGVEETVINCIIRDFDEDKFNERKEFMGELEDKIIAKYGRGVIDIEIRDQYMNMKEKIEPVKYVVDIAFKAMKEVGVEPKVRPIRGGTDGAQLSFKGLPTPNIFTGGHNFHGRFEYIPVFAMEKAVEVILKIVELYADFEVEK